MYDAEICDALTGGELDTVAFVRDYVELRIDYNVLRCMTGPIVISDGREVRFPSEGSRDALCGLIGGVVEKVEITADAIELRMASGESLICPLDRRSRTLAEGAVLPEALHFVPADLRGQPDGSRMVIW